MEKRGISPLIATILLIGLVVVIALFVFNWIGSVIDSQTSSTDDLMETYMTDLSFDFDCQNDIDLSEIYIMFSNNYHGPIDSFLLLYNDSTMLSLDGIFSLEPYQSASYTVVSKNSQFIEAIPLIEINGELQSINHKKVLRTCTDVGAPVACSDGLDNDGDGYSDLDDPDCEGDSEGEVEGGTISFSSCDDENLDDFFDDGYPFVLMDNIDDVDGDCLVFQNIDEGITIDCEGHYIHGGNDVDSQYGIYIYNSDYFEFRDCEISGFEYGIALQEGSDYNIFEDISLTNNWGQGQGTGLFFGVPMGFDQNNYNTFRDILIEDGYSGFKYNDDAFGFNPFNLGNEFINIQFGDHEGTSFWCLGNTPIDLASAATGFGVGLDSGDIFCGTSACLQTCYESLGLDFVGLGCSAC